jgi:hypothetical protein
MRVWERGCLLWGRGGRGRVLVQDGGIYNDDDERCVMLYDTPIHIRSFLVSLGVQKII